MSSLPKTVQEALVLRGALSMMPPELREKVETAERKLRAVILEMGEEAIVALGIIGAEMVANETAKEERRPLPFPPKT